MMPLSAQYPKRPSHFAYRFIRLMAKRCLAQEIGAEACWLLTVIATQEDARRYAGPVTFYNGQLMPLCGLDSENRLARYRKNAIAAGWLHYESRGNRKAAVYWVTIPSEMEAEDGAIDEGQESSTSKMEGEETFELLGGTGSTSKMEADSGLNRDRTGIEPGLNRGSSGGPPILFPIPIPNTNERARSKPISDEKPKRQRKHSPVPSDDRHSFDVFWSHYPRKVAKKKAQDAFIAARGRLTTVHGDRADEWLIERVKAFATSPKGQSGQFCPHASTWLAQERYNDDPAEWQREGMPEARSSTQRTAPGQRYSPGAEVSF